VFLTNGCWKVEETLMLFLLHQRISFEDENGLRKTKRWRQQPTKEYNLKIDKAILLRVREREREEHKTRPGTPEKLSTLPHPNCGKTIRNWHSTNNGLNGHTGGGPNIRIWNSQ
jgi:hypothetical protein